MRRAGRAKRWRGPGPRVGRTGALLGVATLGFFGLAEVRRLRRVPVLPSVAGELDTVVGRHGTDAAEPVHLLVLGDSVAAGVGVDDACESFPCALAVRLADATGRPVRARSLGVAGARAADVLRAQVPRLAAADGALPDVAVLSVGVNDVTHRTPPRRFAVRLEAIAEACRARGVPLVVTGLPDFRALAVLSPPLRYAGQLLAERIHRVQGAVADAAPGARFVDVRGAVGAAFRADPTLLAEDRFHPSRAGCASLADGVLPGVLDVLVERPALTGSP